MASISFLVAAPLYVWAFQQTDLIKLATLVIAPLILINDDNNVAAARRLYEEAVRKEPSTSESWLNLAQFELDRGNPQAALRAVGPALYLDPRSTTVQLLWLQASRARAAVVRPDRTVLSASRDLAEVCRAVPVFAPPADTSADA